MNYCYLICRFIPTHNSFNLINYIAYFFWFIGLWFLSTSRSSIRCHSILHLRAASNWLQTCGTPLSLLRLLFFLPSVELLMNIRGFKPLTVQKYDWAFISCSMLSLDDFCLVGSNSVLRIYDQHFAIVSNTSCRCDLACYYFHQNLFPHDFLDWMTWLRAHIFSLSRYQLL